MPGGGGEPSSSSSGGQHRSRHGEGGDDRAAACGGQLRYGGGDISLGHGHPQLGAGAGNEDRLQDDGSMDMLARHSSSPAGLFSNLVMDNGELATASARGLIPRRTPSSCFTLYLIPKKSKCASLFSGPFPSFPFGHFRNPDSYTKTLARMRFC
jgi:hypothetical protein